MCPQYTVITEQIPALPDIDSFIEKLSGTDKQNRPIFHNYFQDAREIIITRAPGRLDVMGGIADYSGSLVLEMPIAEATRSAIGLTEEPVIEIVSLPESEGDPPRQFSMQIADFYTDGQPVSYSDARNYFSSRDAVWAAYIAGAFLVLMRENSARFETGARLLIESDVPEGKGVSSSAALEVSVMMAIIEAYDLTVEPECIAAYCQKVENLVVGAPCGIMDQMTSLFGEDASLLALRCQPAQLEPRIEIPEAVAFWGIDSGIRHAVSGADYRTIRTAAFMGYRILSAKNGVAEESHENRHAAQAPHWNGYLANIQPSEYEQYFRQYLPDRMRGKEFLETYHHITDPVTTVNPDTEYPVRAATEHPIYENFRVKAFKQLLSYGRAEDNLSLLGELMYQSHASYSACGLGSAGTDRLVHMVRSAGADHGLWGAKITGGGSGGTVAVLGEPDAGGVISEIKEMYENETGRAANVFSGSSPGAKQFGSLTLQRDELEN